MYSIWITPIDEDKIYLSQIIQELACLHNTPIFPPHCTIWSQVYLPLNDLVSIVESSSQGIDSFIVKMKKISYSQSYAKTLFIQLYENKNLAILHQRIRSILGMKFHYEFDPHISLIYKASMTTSEKKKIISILSIKQTFSMVNIEVNRTGDHIERWKSVYKTELDSSNY